MRLCVAYELFAAMTGCGICDENELFLRFFLMVSCTQAVRYCVVVGGKMIGFPLVTDFSRSLFHEFFY
jgi:hypothetical protein